MNSPSFRLAECEAIIVTGLKSFYEVGKALMEIRNDKLYLEPGAYETFDEYCIKKWKFSKQRAYQLMDSYTIYRELESRNETYEKSTIVDVLPATETQVRELSKIKDPEKRAEVWNEVVKNSEEQEKPITAKDVQVAAAKYCEPCHADNCTFRIVSYLTPHYYKRFETLRRGEKEADYLRRVIEAHSDHPGLLLPYMKQLTA